MAAIFLAAAAVVSLLAINSAAHGHSEEVTCLAFSPDGSKLASGSYDGTIRIWAPHTGECTAKLSGDMLSVYSVAFSPDGSRLAVGTFDNDVLVWDLNTRQTAIRLKGHTRSVDCVAFSPLGRYVASAAYDGIKLWDLATGIWIYTINTQNTFVRALTFSPDGTRLLAGADDGVARVWDAASGYPLFGMPGHSGDVRAVAFSPDSGGIVTADWSTLRLWEARMGGFLLSSDQGNPNDSNLGGGINGVAFAPNGRQIVTGSYDRRVRIWDYVNLKHSFLAHARPVTSVAYSPDGTMIASAGEDCMVKTWDAQTGTLIKAIGSRFWLLYHLLAGL